MSKSHEILSMDEFRGVKAQPVGVVVVTDSASETKAHRTNCQWVTEESFEKKVIEGRNKNGRYYFFLRLEDAAQELGARECRSCGKTG